MCAPPPLTLRLPPRLETAWKLFTPLLEQLEDTQPELYPYGSLGPSGAAKLAARFGVRWGDLPVPAAPKM